MPNINKYTPGDSDVGRGSEPLRRIRIRNRIQKFSPAPDPGSGPPPPPKQGLFIFRGGNFSTTMFLSDMHIVKPWVKK
jgi:hypothetical protein